MLFRKVRQPYAHQKMPLLNGLFLIEKFTVVLDHIIFYPSSLLPRSLRVGTCNHGILKAIVDFDFEFCRINTSLKLLEIFSFSGKRTIRGLGENQHQKWGSLSIFIHGKIFL